MPTSTNIDWIDLDSLIENPSKYAESLSINELEKLIIVLKDYYYNTDTPLVPDFVYDEVEDILRNRKPNSTALAAIGAPDKKAVKLPYFMPSQNKAKADSGAIGKWLNKYGGPYVISHKLDGISLLLHYKKSRKQKIHLYTRGNGSEGQDVSHLTKYLNIGKYHIPPEIEEIAIRGELIVPKNVWEKYYSDKPNVRNWVSGMVSHKTIQPTNLKRIQLVTYQIITPAMEPYDQFLLLERMGFHTSPYVLEHKLDETELKRILNYVQEKGEYQVDGLIVTQNKYHEPTKDNPKHSIAFKSQIGEEIQTKVVKVIWNPSKRGLLKPVVVVEPVFISGANVSKATGHYAEFIVKHKIGPGAKITIIRSGEVIPYIKSVDRPAPKPDMPDVPYEWTEGGLDIKLKKMDLKVAHKGLVHMSKTLGIDHLGPGILQKLVDIGYYSSADVLNITLEELQGVPSLGKNAEKVFNSLEKLKVDGVTLASLMDASNLFEHGIGTRMMQLVIDNIPDLLDRRINADLMTELVNIKGIQSTTAEKIADGLPEFKKFLAEIPEIRILDFDPNEESEESEVVDAFNGIRVIFTGVRDKELERIITASGGAVASGISKSHDNQIVVAKDPTSTSNKIRSARDQGIPVVSLEEFKRRFDV